MEPSGREDIVFSTILRRINLDQPDMPASLPGLVPVSLPVPQEVFPEFGSLDFSETLRS